MRFIDTLYVPLSDKENLPRKGRIGLLASFSILLAGLLLLTACPGNRPSDDDLYADCVSVSDAGTHYDVTLEYASGITPFRLGAEYAKKVKIALGAESYPALIDSYTYDVISYYSGANPENIDLFYAGMLNRVGIVRGQIPEDYEQEIAGFASEMCDTDVNALNDGKLSPTEMYMLEMVLDVGKSSQCSAVSVFGDRSGTGNTITGRILDWYGGTANQLSKAHAITTIKNGDKSIVMVGYLGYLAGLTVVNDDKVFAAILESVSLGTLPSFFLKRSYSMDLRYAMETRSTLDAVAAFMSDDLHDYVSGHLIFLSDPTVSKVLENDISHSRALRQSGSALNAGITWETDDSIGSVNSFILQGNFDNHSYEYNPSRWESMKAQLALKGDTVTNEELTQIVSYYPGAAPGNMNNGDLYNSITQQIVVIEPAAMKMKVFFCPKSGTLPVSGDMAFESHPIAF